MIIKIDQSVKVRLLKALQAGFIDTRDFPELDCAWDFYDFLRRASTDDSPISQPNNNTNG